MSIDVSRRRRELEETAMPVAWLSLDEGHARVVLWSRLDRRDDVVRAAA